MTNPKKEPWEGSAEENPKILSQAVHEIELECSSKDMESLTGEKVEQPDQTSAPMESIPSDLNTTAPSEESQDLSLSEEHDLYSENFLQLKLKLEKSLDLACENFHKEFSQEELYILNSHELPSPRSNLFIRLLLSEEANGQLIPTPIELIRSYNPSSLLQVSLPFGGIVELPISNDVGTFCCEGDEASFTTATGLKIGMKLRKLEGLKQRSFQPIKFEDCSFMTAIALLDAKLDGESDIEKITTTIGTVRRVYGINITCSIDFPGRTTSMKQFVEYKTEVAPGPLPPGKYPDEYLKGLALRCITKLINIKLTNERNLEQSHIEVLLLSLDGVVQKDPTLLHLCEMGNLRKVLKSKYK